MTSGAASKPSPSDAEISAVLPLGEGSGDPYELEPRDLRLRGLRVTYFDVGDEKAPPVVFLHGLSQSRLQWAGAARALLPRHRVIALDFPGFGDSELPPTAKFVFGYESLAETAFDLVAALGLGRVTLVGHSMGAGAAIVAAADRPEHVERLVLVAPTCYRARRPLPARLIQLPAVGPTLFTRLFGRVALRPHVLDAERAMPRLRHGGTREASLAMLRRAGDPSTLEARLPRVRAPTLVVWGRHDKVTPWTMGTRLSREIHGARLEVLDCGHAPEAERAALFESALASFLDDPPREPKPGARGPRQRATTLRR